MSALHDMSQIVDGGYCLQILMVVMSTLNKCTLLASAVFQTHKRFLSNVDVNVIVPCCLHCITCPRLWMEETAYRY
jgi:hypothetical protein